MIVDPVDHLWRVYWRAKRRNAGEALALADDVAAVVELCKRASGPKFKYKEATCEEKERAAITVEAMIVRLDSIKSRRRR